MRRLRFAAALLAGLASASAADAPGGLPSPSSPADSSGRFASQKAIFRGRFYAPPPGFIPVAKLPPGYRAPVRSLRFDRRGAFAGTAALTGLERSVYAFGESIHALTRVSTLRARLPFSEGDTVDADRLAEAERILRAEEFLSDAYLAVAPSDSGCEVAITSFDQWTTVPGAGAQVRNLDLDNVIHWRWDRIWREEWYWWTGVSEANLLGTGTRVSLSARHDPERSGAQLLLSNSKVTPLRLQARFEGAWLTDGDSAAFSLVRPLETRLDAHAYGIRLSTREISERFWFDANRYASYPDEAARELASRERAARVFKRVDTHAAEAFYTRSFGRDPKFDIGPFLRYRERYQAGGLGKVDGRLAPYAEGTAIEDRLDVLPGISAALYRYRVLGMRNFRNLKWSESVETGWRLSGEAGKDQSRLGARTDDWRLGAQASAAGLWSDVWWLSGAAACSSFVDGGGDPGRGDGRLEAKGEAAWLESERTATWLSASWSNLFAAPRSAQLTLGDVDGLNGFASHAFAGQAALLFTAEQRWFPRFEWLTMVPAFSAFATAGNAWPSWRDADPSDLHASLGLGLRVGRSKSVQKMVQHVNVNVPLDERLLPGVVVTVLAKRAL
jgi:hypothetical protein